MKIDFDKISPEVKPHFQGGDKEFVMQPFMDENAGRIFRGRLVPGASIGMHTHTDTCEIIYVISGEGRAVCNGEEEHLTPGLCHYCPKGSSHTLRNAGEEDLVFFAIVSPRNQQP